MPDNPFKKGGWKFKGNTTKPGDHKWDEYEDEKTGQKTLTIITPKKISDFDTCDHDYALIDGSNAQCKRCGHGQPIVWGLQIIKDGKIISNH